jgi:hypothetical protein
LQAFARATLPDADERKMRFHGRKQASTSTQARGGTCARGRLVEAVDGTPIVDIKIALS